MMTFIEAHRGERTQFWPIKLCYSGGNLLSPDNDCCFCLYSRGHLTPFYVTKYATNPNGIFISANSRILLLLLDLKLVEQHFAVHIAHIGCAGLVLLQKQCASEILQSGSHKVSAITVFVVTTCRCCSKQTVKPSFLYHSI